MCVCKCKFVSGKFTWMNRKIPLKRTVLCLFQWPTSQAVTLLDDDPACQEAENAVHDDKHKGIREDFWVHEVLVAS